MHYSFSSSYSDSSLAPMAPVSNEMTHGGSPEHRSAADEPCYLGYSAMFGDDRAMRTLTSLDDDDYIIKHFGASDLVQMIMQEQAAAFTNITPEEMADHAVRRLEELGCSVIGVKPKHDDPSVMYLKVPASQYSLRLWSPFEPDINMVLLDYFDDRQLVPVNQPKGFTLWPHYNNGDGSEGPVRSAHSVLGQHFDDVRGTVVPEGKDWYYVVEASYLTLKRDGVPDYDFQVPVFPRSQFGQFTRNPYASV
ncbi:hypothetical protein OH76DRAFT_1437699 [Lentinus brumalis]|uniref:Uncharacterized protein n=1 Tax=Lentinus brumalis TaxID=2498619 RepID=A0A371DCY5_9APHY|nr:hypothetical protein OH76DRAFT_1437699 [Polyporus brumalis]